MEFDTAKKLRRSTRWQSIGEIPFFVSPNSDQILLVVENLREGAAYPARLHSCGFFCGTHQLRVVALPPPPLQEAHFVSFFWTAR